MTPFSSLIPPTNTKNIVRRRDSIEFHCVAANSRFIETPSHIKQVFTSSFHKLTVPRVVRRASNVFSQCQHVTIRLAGLCEKLRRVNLRISLLPPFICLQQQLVNSFLLSKGNFPSQQKGPALIFFSCLPFSGRNTLETYLAPCWNVCTSL